MILWVLVNIDPETLRLIFIPLLLALLHIIPSLSYRRYIRIILAHMLAPGPLKSPLIVRLSILSIILGHILTLRHVIIELLRIRLIGHLVPLPVAVGGFGSVLGLCGRGNL